MAKAGTKSAVFGYFWARIFKKLLTYLKWVPSNLSICEILPIMSKFGTKYAALFGYFCVGILKKYCHIWNQHPRISLTAKFHKKIKNV